ncbi:MAG: sulfatase [Bradymonadia bacterium]
MSPLSRLTAAGLISVALSALCFTASADSTPTKSASTTGGLSFPQPWRSLVDEAIRAEVSVGGQLIDMGTADQHKYTRGGWETGWGELKTEGETTYCGADEDARLRLAPWQSTAKKLVMRVRSPLKGQKVTVRVGDKVVGGFKIGRTWSVQSVRFPSLDYKEGHTITLVPQRKWSGDALQVDWLWLAEGDGPAPRPGPRVGPVDLGDGPRNALLAPEGRDYAFYLIPKSRTSLTFDYGSRNGGRFLVKVQTRTGRKTLFSAPGKATWQKGSVDLRAYAGEPVRLILSVEGAAPGAGWAAPTLRRAIGGGTGRAAPMGAHAKNAVVIVIDTVRADAFSAIVPEGPSSSEYDVQTPHYDALAKESTAFTQTYNNENWTKPSVATILSGLYPTTHGTRFVKHRLPDEVVILPEHLKESGLATGAISANKVMGEQYGFVQGWDTFDRADAAEDFYDKAIDWVRAHKDERFFLYLQPIDPHTPYEVPSKYSSLYYPGRYRGQLGKLIDVFEQDKVQQGKLSLSADDLAWAKAVYHGEITYHDEHMGRFVAELRKMGLLDDTLVVVTNDHGEEFYEHKGMGHGWTLYEEMIRAPLIMRYPSAFPEGARISSVTEHVDLAHTVTDVLGVPPMADTEGQSLVPYGSAAPKGLEPPYALSFARGYIERRALRVGPWKLIEHDTGMQDLFEVTADRLERHDLADDRPIARRLCELLLGEALAVPDKADRLKGEALVKRFSAQDAVVDEATRAHLEALGYIGGAGEAQEGGDDAKQDDEKGKPAKP